MTAVDVTGSVDALICGPGLCPVRAAPLMTSVEDAATHPVVIYVGIGCTILVLVAAALSRALPPVIESWGRVKEARRAAEAKRAADAQAAEDARIIDLSHQVDHLAGRVWSLEQQRERQQAALIEHAAWDQQLIHAAIAAGVAVQNPPPLYAVPGD